MRRGWYAALICIATLAKAEPESDVFSFAVMGSAVDEAEREARTTMRAIPAATTRFVVHFDLSVASPQSCADAALDGRKRLLDASPVPIVPVVAASAWAACGAGDAIDATDRLMRVGDTLFDREESAGQARQRWTRQSALPRFGRYRENLRWQSGRVLFVTFNLPDNNNNVRRGAGRNAEFEDRSLANHGWLERTFRYAVERRLAGIAIFVDAAPRFELPLRPPDPSSRDRDGYYEWKNALRTLVASYKGQVLLVQGHPSTADEHPLKDGSGRAMTNFTRVALSPSSSGERWMRVDVDSASSRVFTVTRERVFDDPSGELYGSGRVK